VGIVINGYCLGLLRERERERESREMLEEIFGCYGTVPYHCTMNNCCNCKKPLEGKKSNAKFCSDLCRALFNRRKKFAEKQANKIMEGLKEVELIEKGEKAAKMFDELLKELGKEAVGNLAHKKSEPEKKAKEVSKHPLWKEGDPPEYSNAFFFKYDCKTYEQLVKLKK
jgi:hypothetical protein